MAKMIFIHKNIAKTIWLIIKLNFITNYSINISRIDRHVPTKNLERFQKRDATLSRLKLDKKAILESDNILKYMINKDWLKSENYKRNELSQLTSHGIIKE
ncbi:MAG: hypothetical protein IPO33_16300 [Saprospiraceae bacterium]|nr:hypothetical protein [Candidatus Brachybacter algidus]